MLFEGVCHIDAAGMRLKLLHHKVCIVGMHDALNVVA